MIHHPAAFPRRRAGEIDELICAILAGESCSLSAYDIAARASQEGQRVVPAQVYRTLARLVRQRGIFCRRGSRDEHGATTADDRAGACRPVDRRAVPAGVDQPVVLLLCAGAGDGGDAGADGGDRRLVPGSSLGWQPPDGAAPQAPRPCGRASAGAAVDGEDGTGAHLSAAHGRAIRIPSTGSPRIRCAIWRSPGRATGGAPT